MSVATGIHAARSVSSSQRAAFSSGGAVTAAIVRTADGTSRAVVCIVNQHV